MAGQELLQRPLQALTPSQIYKYKFVLQPFLSYISKFVKYVANINSLLLFNGSEIYSKIKQGLRRGAEINWL